MFEFLSGVLCLGEDMELPQKERGLRLGQGKVRLGEPEDEISGLSGPPRRGCCLPRRGCCSHRRR